MNKELSIYLDLMRFLAALWVFLAHLGTINVVDASVFTWLPDSGRDAVVIFFVLSGFVISYTCYERDRGPLQYVSSRCGRIYSVAIPVLILTVIADLIFIDLGATSKYYPLYQYDKLYIYLPLQLFFAGELWTISEYAFSNSPYWSLCYEVWYYVLFGVFFYLKGAVRVIGLTTIMIIMGFKLWLLLPVWWLGVWLHNNLNSFNLGKGVARCLFWGSFIIYIILLFSPLKDILIKLPKEVLGSSVLGSAGKFLSDYAVAILFAMSIVGYRYSDYSLSRFGEGIKRFANYTFILYLGHCPIIVHIEAYAVYDKASPLALMAIIATTLSIILLLAPMTENRKGDYKKFFDYILQKGLFLLAPLKSRLAK